ncbi:hypothetical protein [Pseudonocardia humida]|uniref:Immunity protein 21 of polymorphic toxin system n=1 Tax=Pseudonocardia humida TaxID=2800819 RepID=A0ABT1A9T7_9PSEU|nr:hypothetical protein [Pseudonocardia humida]MCO1659690.1 hypothetical protein [Pseudonocardia humida]
MRGTEIAFVEHGQYCLGHPGAVLPFLEPGAPANRLLLPSASDQGGVVVQTGTIDGPVSVTVETFDQPPATAPDGAEWERVEDLVAVSKGDRLLAVVEADMLEDVPEFAVAPGDRYHVRLSVRGFDAGRAAHTLDTDDEPVEHHLVQLWQEP